MTLAALSLLVLSNAFGRVEVSTLGAQVTSYAPAGRADVLFMPADRDFSRNREMHGGIPVCWPWFGRFGEPGSRMHGLARYAEWTVAERTDSRVVLALESSEATRKVWPHDFRLRYTIDLAERLRLTLVSENTGARPFKVTQGFHPYFRVADPSKVVVRGLEKPLAAFPGIDGGHPRSADGRYSFNVDERGGRVALEAKGESKLVVWNPGPDWDGWKPDCNLARGDWPKFLCVEPAVIGRENAILLAPGGRNEFSMTIGR